MIPRHICYAVISGNEVILFSFHPIFVVSQAADLAGKKCVPCNSKDIRAMSEQSANELLVQVQAVPLGYFLFLFLLKGKMYHNIFIHEI